MSRVRAVAVAATAGSAAFIAWDANDRKGGVGANQGGFVNPGAAPRVGGGGGAAGQCC